MATRLAVLFGTNRKVSSSEDPEDPGDDSSEPEDDDKGGGGGGGGGGSDGGHSDDSLLSAAALSNGPSKKKDSETMKSLGKIPSNIAEWPRYRRTVFRTVSCACGTPQLGTGMLLAAEAHTGPPHKLKVHEPWGKGHGPLSGPSHGCHDGPGYDPRSNYSSGSLSKDIPPPAPWLMLVGLDLATF